jgi:hypothetical protein
MCVILQVSGSHVTFLSPLQARYIHEANTFADVHLVTAYTHPPPEVVEASLG